MPSVVSFILLLVFALETAVPVSSLGDKLVDRLAPQVGELSSAETEESCETETKVKEKEVGAFNWFNYGIESSLALDGMKPPAFIDFFVAAYFHSPIDEPPEI